MPDPKPGLRRKQRWRPVAVAGLSLADDVAVAAFAHGRWAAGRAALLGPKGMLLAGALGLALGGAWCALDRSRAERRRQPSRARRLGSVPAPGRKPS
jgi:hypothetical protein